MCLLIAAVAVTAGSSTKVTAHKAFRHDAGGFTYFSGGVQIDGKSFVLRADRAYVYFGDEDIDVKRIAAFGGVTVTNGVHGASADGALFLQEAFTIDLMGSPGRPAEAVVTSGPAPQTVKGGRIRLYTKTGRVEVLHAGVAGRHKPQGGLAWNIRKSKR